MNKNKETNKRIIIVIPTNEFGGSEHILEMIAQELAFSNRITLVYLYSLTPKKPLLKINTIVISNKSKFCGYVKFIPFIIKQIKYDVVISSQLYLNFFLSILRKMAILKTRKLILRESTMIFQRFKGIKLFLFKVFYKLGYKHSDLVVCSTEIMKNDLLKNLTQANKWSIQVLPNPVNIEILNSQSENNLFGDHYADSESIVAAGRLIKVKGFDVLIDAFEILKNKYPNLMLLILGEGEEKQNLNRKIGMRGLKERVKLLGYVENPIPFFKRAKTCVVSSFIEGFPNVLLQMMSQNERVVSTTCAGNIDEIKGLLTCAPGNVKSLAKCIDEALQLKDGFQIRKYFDSYLNRNSINNYVDTLLSSKQNFR